MGKLSLFAMIFLLLVSSQPVADPNDEDWVRRYDCRFCTDSIIIDGIADESVWKLAPEVGEFTRFQKEGSLKVTYPTIAKMLWDENNLYFLVIAEDPDIWSTMSVRDKECLCLEETVEIFIDPDGDGKDYAEIHINCLNTINDIWIPKNDFKYHDGSPVDWTDLYAWTQAGMQHAVMNYGTLINKNDVDKRSMFEIAMPWKGFGKIAGSVNIPPHPGDIWRININRYERPRKEDDTIELSGWAPLNLQSYHVPERFGYVTFVSDF